MNIYDELLSTISEFEIIDTHEHLPARETDRPADSDVLSEWLTHYFSCDLISAGLSDAGLVAARDTSRDLLERWDIIEPYWHAARTTGYGRVLDLTARDLYGIARVERSTICALNEAFLAARSRGGHYDYVLKEKSRIALSVVDSDCNCDRRYFASAKRFDDFIMPLHRTQIEQMGEQVGMRIHRLADWEEALSRSLQQALDLGMVTLKSGLAYLRPLHFPKVDYSTAEREFNNTFSERNSPAWRLSYERNEALQNYMMHALLRLADQQGLTIQIHTGLQEGNGNIIVDANPVQLTNLFLEYGNVRFDLFHMGYPYLLEMSALAKNYRNVYIDMCWGHILSPEASRRALVEWLDTVPANKICAFGGDYCFVDGVYGHQYLARRNVAAALTQKIDDGSFDLDRAKEIAHWLFIENPMNLFNLSERVALK